MAWNEILDAALDALIDTAKLLPFLFITYLVMEWLEHRTEDKTKHAVEKAGRMGPFFGSILGVVPQCGFSAAAAGLYSGRVITLGTLIAVFLSTSDEMLPILLSSGVSNWPTLVKAIVVKLVYGMIAGFAVDGVHHLLLLRGFLNPKHMIPKTSDKKRLEETPGTEHIKDLCEQEKCECERGIFRSAIMHTLQVVAYVLGITMILNIALVFIGEDFLSGLLTGRPILGALIAGLVGLIPNCAASVVITQMYLENAIGAGAMLAGLMVGAGTGLIVLFRMNKGIKQNLTLLGILYVLGVVGGLMAGLLPIWN